MARFFESRIGFCRIFESGHDLIVYVTSQRRGIVLPVSVVDTFVLHWLEAVYDRQLIELDCLESLRSLLRS